MLSQRPQMFNALWEVKKKGFFFPSLVVDVGACTGTNGLYGLFSEPEPFYLLIEPLSEFNSRLEHHMGSKHFQIVNCCLLGSVGTAKFKVDHSKKDSSHIIKTDTPDYLPGARVISVPVETLDNLLADDSFSFLANDACDIIIKIDVQGPEPDVIEGAAETIKKHNCLLIVEVGTSRENAIKIFSMLDSLGYRLVDCIDFVKFPGATKVTSQFDAVFMLK